MQAGDGATGLAKREPADPLKADLPLPFHHVLFPYGFPVHVKSNDPVVIRAAETSWGSFTQRFRETPIEIRFVVTNLPTRRKPAIPQFCAQSNLLTIVADGQNFACCDLLAGFGFAYLTKAITTHTEYLRYYFLEAMAYTLLDTCHLVALHAACLQFGPHGYLLTGESGVGKSTLAYACARRGWTYISDDSCSLVRRRSGRTVLGNSHAFRFRPSVSSLFPEITGTARPRNGKPTIVIRSEQIPNLRTAHECEVDFVIFLNRSAKPVPASLSRVSRQSALPRLFQRVWPPELPIHEERLQAVEHLLAAELYELTYSGLDEAIDLLERMS